MESFALNFVKASSAWALRLFVWCFIPEMRRVAVLVCLADLFDSASYGANMTTNASVEILHAYDQSKGIYEDFCFSVERLLKDFLNLEGIRFVDVTSRVKKRDSLERKIARKGNGRYQKLADITDICGIRVITYFEGDVKRVADIVEREFAIDRANSIDKYHAQDPGRFGYRSMHFVALHRSDRRTLMEYRRFDPCKIEIQVRSILQHAWAEIEHDLGYKSTDEVPALVQRRFSRLAGLLELADEEFMTIRKEVDAYKESLAERLGDSWHAVMIDADSLLAFLNTDPTVKRIDEAIVNPLGVRLVEGEDVFHHRVSQVRFLGFEVIGQLKAALVSHEELVVEFSRRWLNRPSARTPEEEESWTKDGINRGISVFYLAYVLLLIDGNENRLSEYGKKFFWDGAALKNELLSVYRTLPGHHATIAASSRRKATLTTRGEERQVSSA